MLNLVTGRSGCGKTEYLRSILRDRAVSGDSKLLLIVPEQFSFESERAFLTDMDTKDAQRIEVLSFTRLCDYVGRELGGLCGTVADSGIKIIVMLRALEGLSDSLEWYSSHIHSVSLAKELISLISEFKKERVTPEMLREVSEKTSLNTLRVKLGEIALIYEAYNALLSQSYIDNDSEHEKLIGILKRNNFFDGYTICIDAFKGFTGQEFEIIKYLILQAYEVYLSLTTDSIKNTASPVIFGAVTDTAKRLEYIAKECGAGIKIIDESKYSSGEGVRFLSEELAFLEKNIFSPAPERYEKPQENISLVTADNIHDECAFIASTVRKLVRENKMRLSDIAIIVRNEESYSSELRSALKHCEIPVFEDKRQPIGSQPLMCCCKSVLGILKSGFTTENILRYLKCGLSPLEENDISELENYALMWNLRPGDWLTDFEASPAGTDELKTDDAKERNKEKLTKLNESRKQIILPLVSLKNSTNDATASEISKEFYDFLVKTHVQNKLKDFAVTLNENGFTALACEQDKVWDILMDILSNLSAVHGDIKTDIATYENLFCAVLSVTDIGSIPHTLDEISVGSADRIRLANPKVVFVAGCAEGVFPAVWQDSGVLSLGDRKIISELGINLGLSNELKACDEYFIAYSAVTSPREKLYVSYHKSETDGTGLIPSVVFESIKEIFSDSISVTDVSTLSPLYFSETTFSSFFSYARNCNAFKSDDEETVTQLNSIRYVLSENGFEDRFTALDRAAQKKVFTINDKNISTQLFGNDMFLSASRVDVYHKCPFEYFCKYGIRAMPRKRATIDPALSGTVVHFVLENILREIKTDELISLSDNDLKAETDKWLDIYLNDFIGGNVGKTKRFIYLYNRLSYSLYDIIKRLRDEFSQSEFVPCDFELPIDNKAYEDSSGVPSYTLSLSDGGTLEIHGSVDRVDKYEKDGKTYIRIVDYKSGGKEFVLSDVLYGLNMQMLIYLFAIEAGGQKRYGNVVPAGIMYYTAKRISVSMSSKSSDPESIEKKLRKERLGSGLFLSDENTLLAMEKELGGKFIPVGISKSGDSFTGNVITAEQMGKLRRRIDDTLRQMAENLHSGIIPATPAHEKNRYKNTCKYCDYSSVCGMPDENIHEIEKIDTKDIFDMLNEDTLPEKEGENNE